jgi:4-carboxymuconolactone decarboxylase
VTDDRPIPPTEDRRYAAALHTADRLLGTPLAPFLASSGGEPANSADFKRLATLHAFGDVWPREEHLDLRARALVSVAIAATLGVREPLRGQVRIALNCGADPAAVVEVFLQVAVYAGVARAFEGYAIAGEVFGEPGREG